MLNRTWIADSVSYAVDAENARLVACQRVPIAIGRGFLLLEEDPSSAPGTHDDSIRIPPAKNMPPGIVEAGIGQQPRALAGAKKSHFLARRLKVTFPQSDSEHALNGGRLNEEANLIGTAVALIGGSRFVDLDDRLFCTPAPDRCNSQRACQKR